MEDKKNKTLTPANPYHTAMDIANDDVRTLTMDDTVKTCINFMVNRNVRHALVVETSQPDRPAFVGVISQRDILRQTLPENKRKGKEAIDPHLLRQMLSVIVARKPISATPQTPIPDALELMIKNRIDLLPILSDSNLAGIVTTADILKTFNKLDKHLRNHIPQIKDDTTLDQISQLCPPETTKIFNLLLQPATNIMTTNIVTLTPENTLAQAMQTMQAHQIRHLIIAETESPEATDIEHPKKIIAIVSDRDILKHLPFAGKRPTSVASRFREHLFRINPHTVDLDQPIDQIASSKVQYISPATTTLDAALKMKKLKISSLPVLDQNQNILGVVTITDMIKALLSIYPQQDSPDLAHAGQTP